MRLWQDTESELVRRMFDVHVFGAERAIRAVVPSMRIWPGLARRIMEKIGFGALERVAAQRMLPPDGPR